MNVAQTMEERNAFSFEVFPPKTDAGMEKLCGKGGVLEQLYTLNPDYISCTYGAGGTNVGKNLEVLDKIVADGKTRGVTHFTCIGNTKEGIKEQLQTYLDHGIDHMLALRGDLPFGWGPVPAATCITPLSLSSSSARSLATSSASLLPALPRVTPPAAPWRRTSLF